MQPHDGPLETPSAVALSLVSWYRKVRRDLPWRRRAGDAYAVWVSEIMLQQTTVTAVVPYYERWMARFPTIDALADASVGDVLALWAGLGYYARARNLHAAAQQVVRDYAGRVPDTTPELRTLPGVGEYTAGAIASIAYGAPVPLVDANVARVVSRLYGLREDPRSTSGRKELWRRAEHLVPPGDASDFNQALMELGALVCTPVGPLCATCPVQSACHAFASGEPTRFPAPSAPKNWTSIDDAAVVLEAGPKILLVRRDLSEKLWGGLWELPRVTRLPGERIGDTARRALLERGLDSSLGLKPFASIKHVVANRRITLHGYRTACDESAPSAGEFVWAHPDALAELAMATPQIRLLNAWRKVRLQTTLEMPE